MLLSPNLIFFLKLFLFNYLFFYFSKDPKTYVQTVLEVHKKYNALVMTAFNNDAGFVAALDKVGFLSTLRYPELNNRRA